MDPEIARTIGWITVVCIIATFLLTVLTFIRTGMGERLERLEKSDRDCQEDRLRLEREKLRMLEEIARLSRLTEPP